MSDGDLSPIREILRELEPFRWKYDIKDVYYRFLEYTTRSIVAACLGSEEKELEIQEIFKTTLLCYAASDRAEMELLYTRLFGILKAETEKAPYTDILGPVHMEIVPRSAQSARGMFFSPESVCRMMARMNMPEPDLRRIVKEKGYVTLGDPCSGAGAMILAGAWVMNQLGFPSDKLRAECIDIDVHCCYCAYIQMMLNGIYGVVKNGNSLSQEFNFTLVTPSLAIEMHRDAKEKAPDLIEDPVEEKVS